MKAERRLTDEQQDSEHYLEACTLTVGEEDSVFSFFCK
jgi:hypothetical protein